MARTSRNSHGGLKSIKIHDEETTVSYITEFGKTISVGSSTNGSAYSKAVNNGGWTCPSGPLSLNNQGIIKSIVWSISNLSLQSLILWLRLPITPLKVAFFQQVIQFLSKRGGWKVKRTLTARWVFFNCTNLHHGTRLGIEGIKYDGRRRKK